MDEESGQIEEYLRVIEALPPLSEEEIRQLIRSREEALQQVTQAHLHLVVDLAKESFKEVEEGEDLTLEDLICEGNIGLLHAVSSFQTTAQEPFKTYATLCIREAITHTLTQDHEPGQ